VFATVSVSVSVRARLYKSGHDYTRAPLSTQPSTYTTSWARRRRRRRRRRRWRWRWRWRWRMNYFL
jgi:hypothetical protein